MIMNISNSINLGRRIRFTMESYRIRYNGKLKAFYEYKRNSLKIYERQCKTPYGQIKNEFSLILIIIKQDIKSRIIS